LRELLTKLPKPERLLACAATQLDGLLLASIAERIKQSQQDPIAPRNISLQELQGIYAIGDGVTFLQRSKCDAALTESWQRLMNGGYLMEAVGQAHGVMTLTGKGLAAADAVRFEEIRMRQSLTREMLHPDLRGSVYDSFAAGHYDTAVLDAFKLVEDAVRNAASLPASLVGVSLMRQAYDPKKGPLRDPSLPPGERDRMPDLFAGALGVFKNPLSHRKVGKSDPAPVIEELMLASRLLRFVRP
jgi:uncharacterized protein (TIGR02391 family)